MIQIDNVLSIKIWLLKSQAECLIQFCSFRGWWTPSREDKFPIEFTAKLFFVYWWNRIHVLPTTAVNDFNNFFHGLNEIMNWLKSRSLFRALPNAIKWKFFVFVRKKCLFSIIIIAFYLFWLIKIEEIEKPEKKMKKKFVLSRTRL